MQWNLSLSPDEKEQDDWLHNPDPKRDHKIDSDGNVFTGRGISNVGCLVILALGLLALLWVHFRLMSAGIGILRLT
jgi:beta-glucan synthesis-associated protein KRE6